MYLWTQILKNSSTFNLQLHFFYFFNNYISNIIKTFPIYDNIQIIHGNFGIFLCNKKPYDFVNFRCISKNVVLFISMESKTKY